MSNHFYEYMIEPNSPPESPSHTFFEHYEAQSLDLNQMYIAEVHNYLQEKAIEFYGFISITKSHLRRIGICCIEGYRQICEKIDDHQIVLKENIGRQVTILSNLLSSSLARLKSSKFPSQPNFPSQS